MPNSNNEAALGIHVNRLMRQHKIASDELAVLVREVAPDDEFGAYFLDRLRIAADTALGSVVLAERGLSVPASLLTRNMLENLITTHWASLSNSNVQVSQNIFRNEILRLMKRFLSSRVGTIRHKRTGEDRTEEILARRIFQRSAKHLGSIKWRRMGD